MAQSALSVFYNGTPPATNTIGLLPENLFYGDGKPHLLLRRYSETATRTRTGIVGAISGCTLQAAYSDPVLTIDLSGWVLTRGGFANAGPGALIDSSIIANWRNGAVRARTQAEAQAEAWPEGVGNSWGWDVLGPGNSFIVQDPTFTRVPGSLSEVSLKLVLECTGRGGRLAVVDNGGEQPPEIGTVWRLVTVYTDKGPYQFYTSLLNPVTESFFGTGFPAITGMPRSNPDTAPPSAPINVLGINVQAVSGTGSTAGGDWINGSAGAVTGGGQSLKQSGLDAWCFILPNDGTRDNRNTFLVTGYSTEADALASIGKTAADFGSIYFKTAAGATGWTKGALQDDPVSYFNTGTINPG